MAQSYDSLGTYDWAGSYDTGLSLPSSATQFGVCRARWNAGLPSASASRLRWSKSMPFESIVRATGSIGEAHQSDLRVLWRSSIAYESAAHIRWGAADTHEDAFRARWQESLPFQGNTRIKWRAAANVLQNIYIAPWSHIVTHDAVTGIAWSPAQPHEAIVRIPWGKSTPGQITYRILWAPGQTGNSGYSLPWTNEPPLPPGTPITVPNQATYFMIPALSIIRASDSADLSPFDCSIKLDVASYAWTIQSNCPMRSLTLIDPNTHSDPVVVQGTINGYVGNFIVESYTDARKFGSTGIQIIGRTRHALLGAPYAPLSTYTITEAKNASQIVTDILTPFGFTVTWSCPDWLVPAGFFTVADATPINAIAQVLNAIGAILLPDLATLSFTVVPMYPISPWQWPSSTPSVVLGQSWTSISGQWEGSGQPNYDGIYVSGQNGGAVGLIKITGTAGDNLIPTVTDPLLVNVTANRERGRNELAKARKRKTETVTGPLFPSPVSETNPGIILPTTLLQATDIDGSVWYGQVMSTQVNAAQSNSALSVRQVQTVERHQ